MHHDSDILYGNKKLNFTYFTEYDGHSFYSCYFDFSDQNNRQPYFFQISKVIDILSNKTPILIEHEQILANAVKKIILNKEYENCNVNVEYPPILVENTICSFLEKPYILLDGAHRLAKMKVEGKVKKSLFLVLSRDDFLQGLTLSPFEEDLELEQVFWYRNVVD